MEEKMGYNYTRRIEQQFPCGCRIDEMIDDSYCIVFCSKHDAAPDMYKALRFFVFQTEPWIKLYPDLKIWADLAIEAGNEALAKARGDE